MGKRNWFLSIFLMLLLTSITGFAQSSDNNTPGTAAQNDLTTSQQEGREKVLAEIKERRANIQELIRQGELREAEVKISELFNVITDVPDQYQQLKEDISKNEMSALSKAMQQSNQNSSGQTDDPAKTKIGMIKPILPVYQRVKAMRAEIQKLTRQRKFAEAEKMVEKVKSALKDIRDKKQYSALYADLHRQEVVALENAQGKYQRAANAVRTAIKYNEIKSDVRLLLNTQEKVGLQKEWFDIRENYERSLSKLLDARMPLLKEKLAILRQMDTKKRLSDEEIKKLQAQLKQINGRLQAINKTITETHRKFAVQRDKFDKKDIVLNAEQQKKLRPLVMERSAKQVQSYKMYKEINQHLTNIAENNEITWKDLKENFSEFGKLQDEIWSLRKQLDVLARKAPLTEKDYALAKMVRAKLEKAMAKAEKLMEAIEDAFVDTKTFNKLTLKEKLEFVKLFREVWSKDREFNNLKPTLEDLYKKIFDQPIIIDDPKPIPMPEPKPLPVNQIAGMGMVINERGNDGDHWFIQFEGRLYYPVNLPAKYRINQLEVKFSGEVTTLIEPNSQGSENYTPDKWWLKYPRLSLTSISAPQLPDEPYERGTGMATPTQVIEENINNQNQPANLMNSF